MAIRLAGTRLEVQGLAGYVSGISSARRANEELRNSQRTLGAIPDPFGNLGQSATRAATQVRTAASQINQSLTRETTAGLANVGNTIGQNLTRGVTEAEKRITQAARAEAQTRVQAARAEAQERAQAARSGATQLAEGERRATATVRGEAQARVQASRAEAAERTQAARAAAARTIEEERRATAAFRSELTQRNAAQRATLRPQGGIFGALGGVGGLVAGGIAAFGAFELGRITLEQGKLGAENARLTQSFQQLAAGVNLSADSLVNRLRTATQGTVTDLRLMADTNLLLASAQSSGLQITEEQIATLAQFARLRSTQLPGLTTEGAFQRLNVGIIKRETELLDELGLSTKGIADQLGIDVSQVNKSVESLLAGVLKVAEIEIERFGDPVLDEATKIEQSMTTISNSFERLRKATAQPLAVVLNVIAGVTEGAISGANQTGLLARTAFGGLDLTGARDRITQLIEPKDIGPRTEALFRGLRGNEADPEELTRLLSVIDQFDAAVAGGAANLEKYSAGLLEIAQAAAFTGNLTDAQVAQLFELDLIIQQAAAGYKDLTNAQKAQAAEADTHRQVQRLSEFNAEIQKVTENALRLQEIGAPGADKLVQSLIELQQEVSISGDASAGARAEFDELNTVYRVTAEAAGVYAGASRGAGVAAEQAGAATGAANAQLLAAQGAGFAAANGYAAAASAATALANAQAGISSSIVTSISGLIGSGTIGAGLGGRLDAVLQRQLAAQAPGALAGKTGAGLEFAKVELQRNILNPLQAGLAQIEREMTAEAQQQLSFGKATTSESEKRLKAEQDALRKAVESVPGVFGTSPVTEEQLKLAEFGIPQNFADDFLRRLKAEVNQETGELKDLFPDVDIGQAREALSRIGIQAAEDPRGVIIQLEEAWRNSSLFASKENLALINTDAVEANKRLQTQMEEGRKNIYEFFGIAIEDASEAISGGGGGGGGIDQEALNKRIEIASNKFVEDFVKQLEFSTGVGGFLGADALKGGKQSGAAPLSEFNDALVTTSSGLTNLKTETDTLNTAIILTGAGLGNLKSEADELNNAIVVTGAGLSDAAAVFATKVNEIPPVIWENHIEEFPTWKGEEGIIDAFPGWEHWLGPEKTAEPPPPAEITPSGTTNQTNTSLIQEALGFAGGTSSVPRTGPYLVGEEGPELVNLNAGDSVTPGGETAMLLHSMLSEPVRRALTQPANVSNVIVNRHYNLSVNSRESSGSLVRDFAILRASAAP